MRRLSSWDLAPVHFTACAAALHLAKDSQTYLLALLHKHEYKQVCPQQQQQQQCVSFEAEHQADTDPLLHHWVYQLPSTTG